MFDEIHKELERLHALEVRIDTGERLDRAPHSLVKVTIRDRSCTVAAAGFLELLQTLRDGAGEAAIEESLEYRSGHAETWAVG